MGMAKKLPPFEFEPVAHALRCRSDDFRGGTEEMLIHALQHPAYDVRREAARRMCSCMRPAFALPLADWLLKEECADETLVKRAASQICDLWDCEERTMGILILSQHPSKHVQQILTSLFTALQTRTTSHASR
jgi:hypothetical protein